MRHNAYIRWSYGRAGYRFNPSGIMLNISFFEVSSFADGPITYIVLYFRAIIDQMENSFPDLICIKMES